MITEKFINPENQGLTSLAIPKERKKIFTGRVDINILLAKVRAEKEKENKANLLIIALLAGIIITVGTILSF